MCVAVQVCTFRDMADSTVELINKEFVPLAANGWGFGAVLTARGNVVAPPLRSGDTGGPDGTNNPFAPKRLHAVLEKFKQLPAEKRTASSEELPNSWKGKALANPPAEGIILKKYNRGFHRDAAGKMHSDGQVLHHDSLWMTKAEWQSLVPEHPHVGDSTTVPAFLVSRLGVHHGSGICPANGVKISPTPKPILMLTVEDVSPDQLRLRLYGSLQVSEYVSPLKIGVIDYQVCGCLHYDVKKKSFTRFDMVAVGDVTLTASSPPKGKTMVAVLLFELSPGTTPWQRTPPHSCGGQGAYFKAGPYFE
jgi:hypothetical protein